MRLSNCVALALAFAIAGCSSRYESKLLGVTYQPPKGFELQEEKPGPAPRAVFSNGLELVVVSASLPKIEEGSLAAILRQAQTAIGDSPIEAHDARAGDVRGAPVARYTIHGRQFRQLLYVVPNGARFLVVRLEAGESAFPTLEKRVDLSLSSLRFKD